MKRRQLLLISVVISHHAPQRLQASIRWLHALAHHLHNRMPAADLDILLALARGSGAAHIAIHIEPRANHRRIPHAPGDLPRQSRSGGRSAHFALRIHRQAIDRSRDRMGDLFFRVRHLFRVAVKQLRHVFLPLRAINARPPVEAGARLPRQPDLSRMIRQQIDLFKSFVHREPLRAIAHDHHVVGSLHHRLRQPRNVFDFLHARHAARAPRRPMHHASIQLHHAVFIRQSAVADRVVIRVVFHNRHRGHRRVQRVAAALQNLHPLSQRVHPIRRRNHHRPRPRRRPACWDTINRALRVFSDSVRPSE